MTQAAALDAQPGQRLISLDAFRGATIALMVLVNTAGDDRFVYPPLRHADWHGWTITDTVFPSFLWIAGVALTFSLAKRMEAGADRGRLMLHVIRRSVILYLLGLLIYLFPTFDFSTMRVMGVLQRIAICYAIATAIYLWTSVRGRILWILGLLAVYWILMAFVPAPGYAAGRLDVEGNLAHWVDRVVLGRHNYASTRTWDPEGIVSTLPAIATAIFGTLAGTLLRQRRPLAERTTWMFVAGNALIVAGLICDIWLPINKKLWTSSFALFMAGLDFVALAGFTWIVDGLGYTRWVRPFAIFGMNAIAVYMASELGDSLLHIIPFRDTNLRDWLGHNLFTSIASPVNASLLYAISYVLLMFGIAYVMYRRKWFVRV